MTAATTKIRGRARRLLVEPYRIALGMLGVFSLLLIFKNPDIAIAHTSRALALCARTVIPSLFPFMVLSELLVSSNAVFLLARPLRRPASTLLGICGEGAAAVALGLFCGFPIGARCAASLYRRGRIDRWELSRIICISSAPSSGFLISAVGASAFGDRSFGVLLFAVSTLSSLLLGIIWKFISPRPSDAPREELAVDGAQRRSAAELFTGSITSSALSMLYVCAFVVFFSTLVGALESALSAASIPDWLSALGFSFFELTSGVSRAASMPLLGRYIAAAAVGWSGLSVHFQIMSVASGLSLSFKPYILAKALTALCNMALLYLFDLFL